ncbi:hypothetical protein CDL15_Pgr016292 [Punica granatum]|uniref:Uncharacterized protein n=1 Tax=Punica granatum TaxID=22663 RepID=A0A218W7L4_PUNGR|nr:hypothetical protein CDL15_Pgr016292 [Punica granatum]
MMIINNAIVKGETQNKEDNSKKNDKVEEIDDVFEKENKSREEEELEYKEKPKLEQQDIGALIVNELTFEENTSKEPAFNLP